MIQQRLLLICREINGATLPVMKQALKHPDAMYRFAGALAIANRKLDMHEELIGLLEDDDVYVQQMARRSLVRLSKGQDFGPLPGGECSEQAEAVLLWNSWWRENSK
jgi:hypothetical protein